jgi:hypothetical protein
LNVATFCDGINLAIDPGMVPSQRLAPTGNP